MKKDLYEITIEYILDNQTKFYRLAYSYAGNANDAMDIVQNAICKALRYYGTLKEEKALRTWFYRILVNESLLFIKKRKREMPSEENPYMQQPYYEKGYDISDDLYDQINQLDEEVQEIIKLRFYEEMTLQEISDTLQMNLSTVKAKLYRGLKLLKLSMEEAGT